MVFEWGCTSKTGNYDTKSFEYPLALNQVYYAGVQQTAYGSWTASGSCTNANVALNYIKSVTTASFEYSLYASKKWFIVIGS